MNVAWGMGFGLEETGARNLVFFRAKWLQAAMKGTLCVRRVRVRSYWARFRFSLGVLQCVVVHVCVVGARPLFGRVVLCVFDIFHAALIVF